MSKIIKSAFTACMNGKINQTVFTLVLSFIFGASAFAQTQPMPAKNINFGYSKNPVSKSRIVKTEEPVETENTNQENSVSETSVRENTVAKNSTENDLPDQSVAQKTLDVVKRSSKNSLPPTEIYKVGVGDVLFISIQNAPSNNSTYFTVLNDGTIDYALAGEMVSVSGLTTDEIEDVLREKVKLYENPQIAVKVREYASHAITVLGLVEKAGEKYLQREAIPLFVVKAEAIVEPKATQAVIRRANSTIETANFNDPNSDNILIFPGDIIEFLAESGTKNNTAVPQFYYIGGEVMNVGQKDFYSGITLTQAILASGGLRKINAKQVVIRRKNAEGLLISTAYNLKDIKDGKIPDPQIEAGDTIEILR